VSPWLRRLFRPSRTGPRILDAVVSGESTFVVREDERFRELVEIGRREMIHTRVFVDEPLRSGFPYTDAMHASLWLADTTERAPRVLCFGAGGGIVPRQLVTAGAKTTVIDASSVVLALARDHFDLRPSTSLAIEHADARDYIDASPRDRYDAVLIDLFGAFEAPAVLAQESFYEGVRRTLRPGGAIAVNMVGPLDGTGGAMHAMLHALGAVFGDHLSIPVVAEHERAAGVSDLAAPRNVVAFARRGSLPRAVAVGAVPLHLPCLPETLVAIADRLCALDEARSAASIGRPMPLTTRRTSAAPRRAPHDSTRQAVRRAR
jgi:spermidine synthase